MFQFLNDITEISNRRLILYGAGPVSENLLNKIDQSNFNIEIIDDYKSGLFFDRKIKKYEDIEIKNEDQLVICNRFLERFKTKLTVPFKVYYLDLDASALPNEIHCIDKVLYRKRDKILENLDPESREVFDAMFEFREVFNSNRKEKFQNLIKTKGIGSQYLTFLDSKQSMGIIIDCGVYNGQSSYEFSNFFKKYEHIDGFEPLPIEKLSERHFLDKLKDKNFRIINKACSDFDGKDVFYVNNQELTNSSSVNNGKHLEKIEIEYIRLDSFYKKIKSRISFLKMDIEGEELKAIKGAIGIIREHRPFLAISIYHSLDQFLEIPLYLFENVNEYQWHIRHYSYGFNETVLYGIPN